jgi:hypothetical protein
MLGLDQKSSSNRAESQLKASSMSNRSSRMSRKFPQISTIAVLPHKSPLAIKLGKKDSFKWINHKDIVGPILEEIRSRGFANVNEYSLNNTSTLPSGVTSGVVSPKNSHPSTRNVRKAIETQKLPPI